MLIEQIIKQTVDLQGFRVHAVTKASDGLIAQTRPDMPGTEYAVEHEGSSLFTEICVMLVFFAMFPCGIFRSGSNINLVGCSAQHVEELLLSSFLR